MNNPYYLGKEKSEKFFYDVILPELKSRYDFSISKEPTVNFLVSLLGIRKSKFFREFKNIPVVSINKLRMFHPYIEDIYTNHKQNVYELTKTDVLNWYQLLLKELYEAKCDFVVDAEIRNKEEVLFDLQTATMHKYQVKIDVLLLHEYEALLFALNFYTTIYEYDLTKAQMVSKDEIKASINEILELAKALA